MSKGKATRDNILNRAFMLASENGLQSLTIGELAKQCNMSKSGLFAHFNSKDNLQVAVLEYANDTFINKVIEPVRRQHLGDCESRLKALLENWLSWNHAFQGSCMFLDAWKDNCSEQSDTQDTLKRIVNTWLEYLQIQIGKGVSDGEFNQSLDSKLAVFELYGLYLSAHLYDSIHGPHISYSMFWQGVDRLITSWKKIR
ncbi:TetR/AcrR family transcriptional regulator [Thalassotalea maritima]|uniref:TetR/AcrR family transcriptional regulator n=1 Tax=Thalassotalea maritima TaxID=3242416 RepID=UPI0035293537